MNLNTKDIEVLIDAIKTWEVAPDMVLADLMVSVMSDGMTEKNPILEAKTKILSQDRKRKLEQVTKERGEIAIRLKSKLLDLRDEIINSQANSALNNG